MKRPAASVLAFVAFTIACSQPVLAAVPPFEEDFVPTGSLIRIKAPPPVAQDNNQSIDFFAGCIAKRAPARVDWYLRTSDAFSTTNNPSTFLPLAGCLGFIMEGNSRARFTPRSLRSWLAEEAYLRANKTFKPLPANAPAVPARTFVSTELQLGMARRYGEFADCLVAQNASAADAILRTKRGSIDEFNVAKRLAPALGICLNEGIESEFPTEVIRAYAADGLWQRYEAIKPTTYRVAR